MDAIAEARATSRWGARRRLPKSLRELVETGAEPSGAFLPVLVTQVELSEPLPVLVGGPAKLGGSYGTVRVLVRLHGTPLGIVVVGLDRGPVTPDELGTQILAELDARVRAHLRLDGASGGQPGAAMTLPLSTGCPTRSAPPPWEPLVSVVVCTFRRPRELDAALRALLAMDYPRFEIVLVDNAPDDPSAAELVRDRYGRVSNLRYIAEAEPGISNARNRALETVRGEVVAFTDDDVVVDRGWVSELVSGFDPAGKVSCVTGMTLAAELETPSQIWFEEYGAFQHGFEDMLFSRHESPATTRLYPYTAGVFGAGDNMALRLSALPGPVRFDTRLGAGSAAMGGEDLDVFLSILLGGSSILYRPAAIAWHSHRRSYPELRWQLFGYGAGLTALWTKWVLHDRTVALDLLRRVPGVLLPALSSRPAPGGGPTALPLELSRLERLGLLYGPLAHLRSSLGGRRRTGSASRLAFARPRSGKRR